MWRVWVRTRGVYRVLVGKPEGKRPMGRPRRRWVDNIRIDLQEVGCGYIGWIGLAQDRDRWRTLVSAVMNLRVPWNAGNFLTSCKPVSCSKRTLHRGVNKSVSTYHLCFFCLTLKLKKTDCNFILFMSYIFCLEFYSWLLEVVGCDIHGGIVRGNKEYLILINLTNKNSHK
jgi:hypothetical protein